MLSGYGKENMEKGNHICIYEVHDGRVVKMWQCKICLRKFRHQYTLTRHFPTHTDVRNFVCRECGKAFRQLSTLSQHRAIHSTARPFSCERCQKTFNRSSTLISHRKTHTDLKPFHCPICQKGFHQKGNLKNHVYTHTEERPYHCKVCDKGFNQMSNLVCHTQKAHPLECISLWPCNLCTMGFNKRALLRAHELEVHQIPGASVTSNRRKLFTITKSQAADDSINTDIGTISAPEIVTPNWDSTTTLKNMTPFVPSTVMQDNPKKCEMETLENLQANMLSSIFETHKMDPVSSDKEEFKIKDDQNNTSLIDSSINIGNFIKNLVFESSPSNTDANDVAAYEADIKTEENLTCTALGDSAINANDNFKYYNEEKAEILYEISTNDFILCNTLDSSVAIKDEEDCIDLGVPASDAKKTIDYSPDLTFDYSISDGVSNNTLQTLNDYLSPKALSNEVDSNILSKKEPIQFLAEDVSLLSPLNMHEIGTLYEHTWDFNSGFMQEHIRASLTTPTLARSDIGSIHGKTYTLDENSQIFNFGSSPKKESEHFSKKDPLWSSPYSKSDKSTVSSSFLNTENCVSATQLVNILTTEMDDVGTDNFLYPMEHILLDTSFQITNNC